MKNCAPLLLAICFSGFLYSKSLEYTNWFASPDRQLDDLKLLDDGKIAIAGSTDARSGGFFVVDTNSNLNYERTIGYDGFLNIKVQQTMDEGLHYWTLSTTKAQRSRSQFCKALKISSS